MAENNKKYRFETLQLHVGKEQAYSYFLYR